MTIYVHTKVYRSAGKDVRRYHLIGDDEAELHAKAIAMRAASEFLGDCYLISEGKYNMALEEFDAEKVSTVRFNELRDEFLKRSFKDEYD